jgi:hypothetical protein
VQTPCRGLVTAGASNAGVRSKVRVHGLLILGSVIDEHNPRARIGQNIFVDAGRCRVDSLTIQGYVSSLCAQASRCHLHYSGGRSVDIIDAIDAAIGAGAEEKSP